jgi:anti-anti-sigma factor
VLDAGAAVVVAGMTAIRFCDSQGIGAVVLAHKRATAGGAELRVVIPSKAILPVMDITRVNTVLHICPAVGQALADGMG